MAMGVKRDEPVHRHRPTAGVVVLVVLLSLAAIAVTFLALGRAGAMGVVGDPPRPGWTFAPGPWSGAGFDGGTAPEQMKKEA